MTSPLDPDLRARIAATRWYHVLELPDGTTTPGEFDLRSCAPRVPLPVSLTGLRCLDVGTRDGFWAFEMERRGASEVIGIDLDDANALDWPAPGPQLTTEQEDALASALPSFETAKQALGSTAERRDISIYELSPDAVGTFDVAFVGTLLVHLRDPIGALAAVRRVIRPGGMLVVNEAISLSLTLLRPKVPAAALMTLPAPFWWVPNRQAVRRWVEAAGFTCEQLSRPYFVDVGPAIARQRLSTRNPAAGVLRQLLLRNGYPHVCLLARPVP